MSRANLDYFEEYQRLVKHQSEQVKKLQEMEHELKRSHVRQKILEDKARNGKSLPREELAVFDEAEKLRQENERLQRENKKLSAATSRVKYNSCSKDLAKPKRSTKPSTTPARSPHRPSPARRASFTPMQPHTSQVAPFSTPEVASRQPSVTTPVETPIMTSQRGVFISPPPSAPPTRRPSYVDKPQHVAENFDDEWAYRPTSSTASLPHAGTNTYADPHGYSSTHASAPPPPAPMPSSVLSDADKAYIDSLASTLQSRLQRSYQRPIPPDAGMPTDAFDADKNPRLHAILHDTQGLDAPAAGVGGLEALGGTTRGISLGADTVDAELTRLRRELLDKKAAMAIMQSQFDSLQAAFRAEREVQNQALRQCEEYRTMVSDERRQNADLKRQMQVLELARDQNDRLQVMLKELQNEKEVLNDRIASLTASLFNGEASAKARAHSLVAEHAEREAQLQAQVGALTATNKALGEQLESSKQQLAAVSGEYGRCADELAAARVRAEGLEKDCNVAREQLRVLGAETGLDYTQLREVLEVLRRNKLLGKMGAPQEALVSAQPTETFSSSRGVSLDIGSGQAATDIQRRLRDCERKLTEALTDLSIERSMAADARALHEAAARQVQVLENENSELRARVSALQHELAEIERLLGLGARADGASGPALAQLLQRAASLASSPSPRQEVQRQPTTTTTASDTTAAAAEETAAASVTDASPSTSPTRTREKESPRETLAPYKATAAPLPPASAPASAGLWKESLAVAKGLAAPSQALPTASSAPVGQDHAPSRESVPADAASARVTSRLQPAPPASLLAETVVAADADADMPQSPRPVPSVAGADSVLACELDSLFTSAATEAPSVLQLSRALRVPTGPNAGPPVLLTASDNVLAVRLNTVAWRAARNADYRAEVAFFDYDPVQGPWRTGGDSAASLLAQFEVDGDAAVVAQLSAGGVRVQLLDRAGESLCAGTIPLSALVRGAVEPVPPQHLFAPANSPRVSGEVWLVDASGTPMATVTYTMRTMFPVFSV